MNDMIKVDSICAHHEMLDACCDISVALIAHIVSLNLTFTCTFDVELPYIIVSFEGET